MDADELLRLYSSGERDFSGVDLRHETLVRVCLKGINLSNANLFDVCLISTDLTDANLSGADLTCDMSRAVLTRADLREANMSCEAIGTFFDWADLREASMYRSDLRGARFTRADMRKTNLGCTNLLGADFSKADMRGADIQEAHGVADFSGANLTGAITYGFERRLGHSLFKATAMPDGSIRDD